MWKLPRLLGSKSSISIIFFLMTQFEQDLKETVIFSGSFQFTWRRSEAKCYLTIDICPMEVATIGKTNWHSCISNAIMVAATNQALFQIIEIYLIFIFSPLLEYLNRWQIAKPIDSRCKKKILCWWHHQQTVGDFW